MARSYGVREYLAERKMIIIAVVVVIGLLVFLAARPSDTPAVKSATTTASTGDFKTVNLKSAMSKGSADAKVSIIQYSDFLCPSCTYFSTQVMPTIEKNYIDTGKVKFEFRPMAFVASTAVTNYGSTIAAEGAYCAVDQDKFWEYHDTVYNYTYEKIAVEGGSKAQYVATSTAVVSKDILKSLAVEAGLDSTKFDSCLGDDAHSGDVTASNQAANNNGITSAPYIMVNGKVYTGDISLTAFEAFIKAML